MQTFVFSLEKSSLAKKMMLLLFLFIAGSVYGQSNLIDVLAMNIQDYYVMNKQQDKNLSLALQNLKIDKQASDQGTIELYEKKEIKKEDVLKIINSQSENGSWADINYKDEKRGGWEPKLHGDRVLLLTKAYKNPSSAFYNKKEISTAIHKALQFWFHTKPVCLNWWYNEIGLPRTLGPAFVMLKNELSAEELQGAIEVMNNAGFRMTGQNKVWLAGNVLFKSILLNDAQLAQQARDTIVSEIVLTNVEGIKPDYSFHQHGPQQQFGNYGLSFFIGMSMWGRVFNQTPLAFNPEQVGILRNLFSEAYNWLSWKAEFDVNSLGRQFFKNALKNKALGVGFVAADMMLIDPQHQELYAAYIQRNFGKATAANTLEGHQHFWYSDFTIHRNKDWFSSLKMSSNRVIGGEAGNNENLKGYYLADGAHYIMVDGTEYDDIFPLLDWRKLPGVTCYEGKEALPLLTFKGYQNPSDFVGGLSHKNEGISVFSLDRDGLKAKKAWFYTKDGVIALGADIQSGNANAVTSTINQTYLNGKVYVKAKQLEEVSKSKSLNHVDWVYHHKIGYHNLSKLPLSLKIEEQKGSWGEIAKVYNTDKLQADMFTLFVNHGKMPKAANYAYFMQPGVSLKEVKSYKPDFKVLENSAKAQIINFTKDDKFAFVIYQPYNFSHPKLGNIKFEQAGLYLLAKENAKWNITVADPTQKLSEITFQLKNQTHQIALPKGQALGKSINYLIP
ncbi:polysaccharide lyase family 8 super-sandwich domain-containing protein [Pedobacter puniceum]|uniref:Chondroitinase n=1 Tax=Pedobacter puniceum TaxID=2666136 RepID=A0A7K0FPL9_9SPHI|nr:polysaccharide lyase family 8 super-sandwich domain-containing protein [Pedobacter puniceum]MRX47914.1 chondroitinase [Pedobacter puniceum]